jgi:murein DD-endopeptidase MepM/ murein hydrolase activator NlpD
VKRLAAAVAVALAGFAGTARADTYTPLATTPAALAAAPIVLPSADVPNAEGSLGLPAGWTQASSALPRELAYTELQALWTRAGEAYGIPWQVLAAINKIETNFGRNMGPSSAGAVGWMQFMPDTWLRWGLDATGDRIADPWSPEDAVYAAARYLAAAGGRTDIERGVFAYNHADWYVRDVLQLAEVYGGGGLDATVELDQLQVGLEQGQAQVAAINEQLVEATEEARRLARAEQRLVDRADRARLLSDSLAIRQTAGALGGRRAAAEAKVEALRASLREAELALEEARTASQGAAFAGGTASPFPVPRYEGSFVFPVGGGPAVVSVSHQHHDYPAADIAAPEGAPVYALADAVVERSWAMPTGACGIGATIQTADGQTWTYCHLSYLDPAVVAGALLTAGSPIGLVGSTGHSTGPHLHLQLQPASSYPQDQEWFSSFAGTAFAWQDGDPGRVSNAASGSATVFAVVQEESAAPPNTVITFTR